MSKKYKVKTAVIFDDKPIGSTIELSEKMAKKYEAMGYLTIVEEVKPKPPKAAPKQKPKKKEEKPKTKDSETKTEDK